MEGRRVLLTELLVGRTQPLATLLGLGLGHGKDAPANTYYLAFEQDIARVTMAYRLASSDSIGSDSRTELHGKATLY